MSWSLVIHGGAGAMKSMGPERERAYREGLHASMHAGQQVLAADGSAVDATIAAVRVMEACGAFNAGHGSCLNQEGHIEADAAVMDGTEGLIGAVAAAPMLANAVEVAELIRTQSPHCLLAGEGAAKFATSQGFTPEPAIISPHRQEAYEAQLLAQQVTGPPISAEDLTRLGGTHDSGDTVGAVARDAHGRLAVAVSTGGIWLKHPGRVGDSPLPGAGFWAEDGLGAICATGTGEFIIRGMLCQQVINTLARGDTLDFAANDALDRFSARFGRGKAGLIAIDAYGNMIAPFHTEGMGRGRWCDGMDGPEVAVWPGEP
ncbi:MAG: isoaspartyl peptidase/L-asparaginase family protein, partial [Bradymonadia bacterium]